MDIFNRDLYAKGAEQAFKDVDAGKPKDARGVVHQFKALFWGDDAIDSYIKGYNEGYEKAILKEHNVFYPPSEPTGTVSITSTKGGQAMSQGSYNDQIELLQNLQSYLGEFQERLLGVSSNYARKVDNLRADGMMLETYERYAENELQETQQLILRLVDHISQSDIPAVKRAVELCEAARNG